MTSQQVIVRHLFYARWRSSNGDPHCSMLALDQKKRGVPPPSETGNDCSPSLPLVP